MTIQHGPIALLGTSADPPTLGHQALLEGLLKLFPKVATWASNNPQKKHIASLTKRQFLLHSLVQAIANPGLELTQELSSPWTINTLQVAEKKWPKAELIFVIGSDLAYQIPTWLRAKDILQKARIGIAPRKGWPMTRSQLNTLKSLGGRIELLPLNIPSTASSKVRIKGQTDQLPQVVLTILSQQNLYGLKQ